MTASLPPSGDRYVPSPASVTENSREATLSRVQLLAFGSLIAFFLIALAMLAFKYLGEPQSVTDPQARKFIVDIEEAAMTGASSPCEYAAQAESCRQSLSHNTNPLTQHGDVVCTWAIPGSPDSRAVEINNKDVAGNRYRTTVVVRREFRDLTAEPVPYWDKHPTREVPHSTAHPPAQLPQDIGPDVIFDPCLHPDASS